MFNKKGKKTKEEPPKELQNNTPYRFFDISYEGNIEEFKKLLKKRISFDFKDMGNNTIYLKVKKVDFETFSMFIENSMPKSTALKKYQEISEADYSGALLSLDKIIHSK